MQRLLIVSNRLPISVQNGSEGEKWTFKLSSGGLVSALTGVKKTTKFLWIGWPGIDVDDESKDEFCDTLLEQYSALPVFIDQKTSNLHYNGFSNSTIWPLFHYLPGEINFNDEQWSGYNRANELFADRIAELVEDGDMVWVHDYHLMLLPKMLRERCKKNISIGFFLHIPFPASDVYRVLPYRREILCGLLDADLIGFHTYDYARHFITACTRILGLNSSPASVEYNGKEVRVGAYPVGIEPEKFIQALHQKETKDEIDTLSARFAGLQVIVGVERLDYIKGLTQKLLAYESFLEEQVEMRGKVVLIQIAIPSRTDVEEYQHLQNQVFELIGRINGKFSTPNYSPVQFMYNSVNFNQLVALYRVADVCLITSTRDGMNLVAYEYIASQKDKNGILILSEFAGAAQSLNGVILINPWSINQIKHALFEALNMNINERKLMYSYLSSYVDNFTSAHWGNSFVTDLYSSHQKANISQVQQIEIEYIDMIKDKNVLLLIDPTVGSLKTIEYLASKLSSVCNNNITMCIYSHKQTSIDIERLATKTMLMADFGETIFGRDRTYIHSSDKSTEELVFHESIISMFEYYLKRCPGSKLYHEKLFILWDFSDVDKSLADWSSCELQINLENMIGHQPLKVTRDQSALVISNASFDLVKSLENAITNVSKQENADIILYYSKSEIVAKTFSNLASTHQVAQLQIPPEYFGSDSGQ